LYNATTIATIGTRRITRMSDFAVARAILDVAKFAEFLFHALG